MTKISKTTPRYWSTDAERISWTKELSEPEPRSRTDKAIDAFCWIVAGLALAAIFIGAMNIGGPA